MWMVNFRNVTDPYGCPRQRGVVVKHRHACAKGCVVASCGAFVGSPVRRSCVFGGHDASSEGELALLRRRADSVHADESLARVGCRAAPSQVDPVQRGRRRQEAARDAAVPPGPVGEAPRAPQTDAVLLAVLAGAHKHCPRGRVPRVRRSQTKKGHFAHYILLFAHFRALLEEETALRERVLRKMLRDDPNFWERKAEAAAAASGNKK